MTAEPVRVSAQWLALREGADAAARSTDLVAALRAHLPAGARLSVHDLGSGTGSMGRWLAPRLPGPQHWVLYDRDRDLLDLARVPATASDGAPVTYETRARDITRLNADDLDGAGLITASALLDMLTAAELDRIVAACAEAHCPTLLTISVIGRVDLVPAEPFDAEITGAFNAHQRRVASGRHLLGPDAVDAAALVFGRLGGRVLRGPSPWVLGPAEAELAVEWFTGWLGAACEQHPELAAPAAGYGRRRLAQAAAGRLGVTVHHEDLLVLPQSRHPAAVNPVRAAARETDQGVVRQGQQPRQHPRGDRATG
jgi:hypothetical protein